MIKISQDFNQNSPTHQLPGHLPGISKDENGYDCGTCILLPDSQLHLGSAELASTATCHDAEPEWTLHFSRPISQLDLDFATPCILQGAIRQRQLHPAPGGSIMSVIAHSEDGDEACLGISTTLGGVCSGQLSVRMRLEFIKENMQGRVVRNVSSDILADLPLLDCLTILKSKVRSNLLPDSRVFRINAKEQKRGYVNERWLKYQSALTAARGVHYSDLSAKEIRSRLVSDIVERREYIRSGTKVSLDVFDHRRGIIGKALLLLI